MNNKVRKECLDRINEIENAAIKAVFYYQGQDLFCHEQSLRIIEKVRLSFSGLRSILEAYPEINPDVIHDVLHFTEAVGRRKEIDLTREYEVDNLV